MTLMWKIKTEISETAYTHLGNICAISYSGLIILLTIIDTT